MGKATRYRFSQCKENAIKDKQEQKNIKVKKEKISERFQKSLKEQKNRLVYSI